MDSYTLRFIKDAKAVAENLIAYSKALLVVALFLAFSPFTAYAAQFTITANAGADGNISPSGAVLVEEATSQAFTITPDAGHHIADVLVDGASVGAVGSFSFDNVASDHTINASFAIDTFLIAASAGSNGNISPSDTTVDYDTTQTFTITPDLGFEIADVVVDGVSVGTTSSYTFSNVQASHTIAVSFVASAVPPVTFDLVATAGVNGTIAPIGTTTVASGTAQTFTITPDLGFEIADVVVDGVSVGTTSSYTFSNVQANHTIAVSFVASAVPPVTHTITATAGSGGIITPNGSSTVIQGDSLTLVMTPDPGYTVATLIVDSIPVLATTTYSFTNVTQSHTITVAFIQTHSVVATAGAHGSIAPTGTSTVVVGGNQTYIITPDVGYGVQSLVIDGVSVTPTTTVSLSTIVTDHTIEVTFAPLYTITAVAGANGLITPTGTTTVVEGDTQVYTITPLVGYDIATLLIDGVSVPTSTTYSFTGVAQNHTIEALFGTTHSIVTSHDAHGSVHPSGTTTVAHGSSSVITITPDPGFGIGVLLIDGVTTTPTTTIVFNEVVANHTIQVLFRPTHSIVASGGSNGSISPSGTTTVLEGDSLTLTITPDTGFTIGTLTVDGIVIPSASHYSFANVTAPHTIEALFIQTHIVTAHKTGNGSITPSSTSTVTEGDTITYLITPDIGYGIATLLVDGVTTTPTTTYTFNNVTTGHTIDITFFALPTHTITVSVGTHGSMNPGETRVVYEGDTITYTVTPDSNYEIEAFTVDGVLLGTSTSHTFANITQDHTIAVTFKKQRGQSGSSSSGSSSKKKHTPTSLTTSTTTASSTTVPTDTLESAELVRAIRYTDTEHVALSTVTGTQLPVIHALPTDTEGARPSSTEQSSKTRNPFNTLSVPPELYDSEGSEVNEKLPEDTTEERSIPFPPTEVWIFSALVIFGVVARHIMLQKRTAPLE